MILEIIILILAIPTGFLISWMAKDELVKGKKWFRILIISSLLIGIWFWLTGKTYITWTMTFILIVSLIALLKSEDNKLTTKKKE